MRLWHESNPSLVQELHHHHSQQHRCAARRDSFPRLHRRTAVHSDGRHPWWRICSPRLSFSFNRESSNKQTTGNECMGDRSGVVAILCSTLMECAFASCDVCRSRCFRWSGASLLIWCVSAALVHLCWSGVSLLLWCISAGLALVHERACDRIPLLPSLLDSFAIMLPSWGEWMPLTTFSYQLCSKHQPPPHQEPSHLLCIAFSNAVH